MSSPSALRIAAPSARRPGSPSALVRTDNQAAASAPSTPPRSPMAFQAAPNAPEKPPRNGHKALVFEQAQVAAEVAAEQERFAEAMYGRDARRPCRSCSKTFLFWESADGDHCSADCSANCPPYSAVLLGMEQPRAATDEEWMAFTEGCCDTSVSRLNGTRSEPRPESPPFGGVKTPIALVAAAGGAAAPGLDICRHWWPLNAPTRCPHC